MWSKFCFVLIFFVILKTCLCGTQPARQQQTVKTRPVGGNPTDQSRLFYREPLKQSREIQNGSPFNLYPNLFYFNRRIGTGKIGAGEGVNSNFNLKWKDNENTQNFQEQSIHNKNQVPVPTFNFGPGHSLAVETKKLMSKMDKGVPRNILNPFKYFVATGNRIIDLWDERKRKNARDGKTGMPGTFEMLSFAFDQMKNFQNGGSFKSNDGVSEQTPPSEALVQSLLMVKELTRRALRCDEEEQEEEMSNELRAFRAQRRSDPLVTSGSGSGSTVGILPKIKRMSNTCKLLSARFNQIKYLLAD